MLRLRQVRKQQKLSLKKLGEKTGLSLKLLSKYELGTVDPPSSKLLSISLALGVPISAIYPPVCEDAPAQSQAATTNGKESTHV
jgi:transcriptional regulator with XRE-family HTH domain